MQATPQEKVAFLAAHPALSAELKARWTSASPAQKQWYAKNYPGIDAGRHWTDISTEERAQFLEANPTIAEKVRESWQKSTPDARAAMARRWQGWPLRAFSSRLEGVPGKAVVSAKAHSGPAAVKASATKPATPAKGQPKKK
jgi:hypothetical protein